MITEILSIQDVEDFIRQLVKQGSYAHPDDDFHYYVKLETGLPVYTAEAAAKRNRLKDQCFGVCEAAGQDVFSVTQEILLIEAVGTNLFRLHPAFTIGSTLFL